MWTCSSTMSPDDSLKEEIENKDFLVGMEVWLRKNKIKPVIWRQNLCLTYTNYKNKKRKKMIWGIHKWELTPLWEPGIYSREDTPLSVVCRRDGFRTASRRFLNEREEKENKRVCLYFLAYKHICLVISYSNRSMSKLKTNASEIVLEY